MILLIPFIMAGLYRASGYGLYPKWLWDLLFALIIGSAFFVSSNNFVMSVLAVIWSFLWKRTGHADALSDNVEHPNRDNSLTPYVLKIASWFKWERNSPQYDHLFWAVKGFLMTLPIGGTGAIALPLGFYVGRKSKWRPDICGELLQGFLIGVGVLIFLLVV